MFTHKHGNFSTYKKLVFSYSTYESHWNFPTTKLVNFRSQKSPKSPNQVTGPKMWQANVNSGLWYWQLCVFEVSHYKYNWLQSVWEDSGLCTADFKVQNTRCGLDADMSNVRYIYLPLCYKHLTLLRLCSGVQPICRFLISRTPSLVTCGLTECILQPNICSPLHKQFRHRQVSRPRRIMQRSVFPFVLSVHLCSTVQQQTAHIQVFIRGCKMQSCVSFSITSVYIGASLQQHPHHLHLAILSSINQRCLTVLIVCSAVVFGVFQQNFHSVHASGFGSLNEIPTGL